jgi:predicted transcriptional regulator
VTPPSETELDLLKLLWRRGAMSARELHDLAGPELGWTVSTTRTVLERMKGKGLIERRAVHGLAVYDAAKTKVSVIGAVIRRVRDLLGVDSLAPASAFAGSEILTPEEAAELEALLAADLPESRS